MSIQFSQGNLPKFTDTLTSDGMPVDLTGATVDFIFQIGALSYTKSAVIVTPLAGRVDYQFAAGETDVPGNYLAQWVVTKSGVKSNFPTVPFAFEIVTALPQATNRTPISDFYETLRFILDDRDLTVRKYPDAVLLAAVRSCIRLQKVSGYSIAPDLTQLTPAVTDPNTWALVCYHTAKGFVDNNPDRYSYRTRAIGESFGSWQTFLDELKLNIYRLENGTMFSGWMNYYTWLAGMSGLPVDLVMTQLRVNAPFYAVGISVDGVHASSAPRT